MNPKHRQRWIIVDDDPQVLRLSAFILREMGAAEICVCNNGGEALRAFNDDPGSVALVLTDWDMPGLNGIELARILHSQSPVLKIAVMSGRHWDLEPTVAARAGVSATIAKPFTMPSLQASIREVLESNAPVESDAFTVLSQAA